MQCRSRKLSNSTCSVWAMSLVLVAVLAVGCSDSGSSKKDAKAEAGADSGADAAKPDTMKVDAYIPPLQPDAATAKPTPGFGKPCSISGGSPSCATGLSCVWLTGWKTGFCSVTCKGSTDKRCKQSIPTGLTGLNAVCAWKTSGSSTSNRCAFVCAQSSSTWKCPPDLECTHKTSSGLKYCKPKTNASLDAKGEGGAKDSGVVDAASKVDLAVSKDLPTKDLPTKDVTPPQLDGASFCNTVCAAVDACAIAKKAVCLVGCPTWSASKKTCAINSVKVLDCTKLKACVSSP